VLQNAKKRRREWNYGKGDFYESKSRKHKYGRLDNGFINNYNRNPLDSLADWTGRLPLDWQYNLCAAGRSYRPDTGQNHSRN
jgi:hypothetical protein